jgi:hypothetical protein
LRLDDRRIARRDLYLRAIAQRVEGIGDGVA